MVHSIVAHDSQVWASHNHKLYRLDSQLEVVQESDVDLGLLDVSPDGAYVLGVAADAKQVSVLDSQNIETVKATHSFPKRPSGISVSGEELVVADKFGDVFHRKLTESSAANSSEPILGHVSMVLDVLFVSPHFVASSDRDEHMRISRFPQSFVIERFLLGHESFVSHLVVDQTTLVSGGGDNYVLSWNWQTGEQLAKLGVDGNVIAMAGCNGKVYIAVEDSTKIVEASLPDLSNPKIHDLGKDSVQSLACTDTHVYVGTSSELHELNSGKKYTFELADSEKNTEKHLKKRRDEIEEE